MRILIIGSGAIGTFIGGILAGSGQDVVFYDLPSVVERIKAQGIIVEGTGKTIKIENPRAISVIKENDRFDLAIVSVKSYSTKMAIEGIPEAVPQNVLTFQNGVENEIILSEKFGRQKVISGAITYPVAYPEPGHVRIENLRGGLGFAPMTPSGNLGEIPSFFEKAGLVTAEYCDYRSLKWSKLMLNIVCNATCAILGMTPAEVFSHRRLVWIERESIMELLRVMDRKKIKPVDLPGYPVKMMKTAYSLLPPSVLKLLLRNKIGKSRGDKKPSLMLEMEHGSKKTEVEMYNGAIAKAAKALGMSAPVNNLLWKTLDGITTGEIEKEHFIANPDELYRLARGR